MRRISTIIFILPMLMTQEALATVRHVPSQYGSIQSAINASSHGDTVLVAEGQYVENINFRGKNILVASNYLFTADPLIISNTIIDGSVPSNPDTASCVIISSGEDTTAMLMGFTLTGGTGTRWLDEHGAGTYVEGGGILIQYSSPTIAYNRIVRNYAIRRPSGVVSAGGGGIRVGDGAPRIFNNVIMENEGMYGGGIVLNYTGGTVSNNIVASNRVYQAVSGAPTFGGGGIWIWQNFAGAGKLLENNTIVGNSVVGSGNDYAGRGGGVLVAGTSTVVRNNIIWENTQSTGGQLGVILSGTANVTFTDVEGGFAGAGNISSPPDFQSGTYYLSPTSPCVDAGDSSASYFDPPDSAMPDLARWPALGSRRNDMGAYGGPRSRVLGAIATAVEEFGGGTPHYFGLDQNYPNPFNPVTTINFHLLRAGTVTLTIYDLLGCEVTVLLNKWMEVGQHQVSWDVGSGRAFASGIYMYRLEAGGQSAVRKMVFLK